MTSVDTLIIGGGITGLSAAYAAMKAGETFCVIDGNRWGGVVTTSISEGFTLEKGPNVFLERPIIRQLIDELGLRNEIRYPVISKYRQYIWNGTSPRIMPRDPIGILTSGLLTIPEKVQLFTRLLMPGVLKPGADDESVLEFLGRVAGPRPIKEYLDIVLKGIYGGEVERLSAKMLFPNLWRHASGGGSLTQFFSQRKSQGIGAPSIFVISGGNSRLIEKLCEVLPKESLVEDFVTALSKTSGDAAGWMVRCKSGRDFRGRKVIVATAGSDSGTLIRGFDRSLAASLTAIEYATLVVVHVTVPRTTNLPKKGFGVLFPRGMKDRFLGVMTNSLVFPHVAPPDRHLLTVCLGGTNALSMCDKSDSELICAAQDGLRAYLKITGAEGLAVTRWPRAVPQLVVGHARTVDALHQFELQNPGIHFSGYDLGGIGVSERVRAGFMAGRASC